MLWFAITVSLLSLIFFVILLKLGNYLGERAMEKYDKEHEE